MTGQPLQALQESDSDRPISDLAGITPRHNELSTLDQINKYVPLHILGKSAAELNRLWSTRPSRRIDLATYQHPITMDELFVHPGKILRLILWRRGTRLASGACLIAVPWCQEQQLLSPKHILRLRAESSLLSLVSQGFLIAGRVAVFRLRLEPKRTK